MNKQTLIQEIEQSELSDNVKQFLLEELGHYSDELSKEDRVQLMKLFKMVQMEEVEAAADLDEAADQLDALVDTLEKNETEAVASQINQMKQALQDADTLVG